MIRNDFDVEEQLLGKVKNYSRKFYQLSVHSRGNLTQPGRVATLVPTRGSNVWGVAYRIKPEGNVQLYTLMSDKDYGGFEQTIVMFYPLEQTTSSSDATTSDSEYISPSVTSSPFPSRTSFRPSQIRRTESLRPNQLEKTNFNPSRVASLSQSGQTTSDTELAKTEKKTTGSFKRRQVVLQVDEGFEVFAFIAKASNDYYSPENNLEEMAQQIFRAKGTAGTNTDYILQLAYAHRELFPAVVDEQLFALENKINQMIAARSARGGKHQSISNV